MQARYAIVAALPREIRGLVGRAKPDSALKQTGVHCFELAGAVVVAGGMGPARASLAFQAAMASGPLIGVISVGLAGGCTAAVMPGSVQEPELVVDTHTGERFRCEAGRAGMVLVSTETIASTQEKTRLAASYGAGLVDMEAAAVARLAQAHGLPFRAVKGISDAHDFELATLSRFAGRHGHFRTSAFALHTALRPHHWRSAMTLGRHSGRALAALTARLRQILDGDSGGAVAG